MEGMLNVQTMARATEVPAESDLIVPTSINVKKVQAPKPRAPRSLGSAFMSVPNMKMKPNPAATEVQTKVSSSIPFTDHKKR